MEIPSTVTGQLSRIDFNGLDAILPVPGLLPTNDDEIIVSFISHADAIESSPEETEIQLNSAIQSSNENLEKSQTVFNVGYSPSNQSIDITYRDILSEGYTISLYNDRGVLIKTIYYYESETSNLAQMMRIDISDLGLMKGIYFVALEKENSISIKKIYIP